jgi:alpha-beta hydrolase superfamily lysophospholipase
VLEAKEAPKKRSYARWVAAVTAFTAIVSMLAIHIGARVILRPTYVAGGRSVACAAGWEAVAVETAGVRLATCVHPAADKTSDAVFLLHGGGDSKASYFELGEALVERGFTAVVIDSRAHGESTGDTLTYGAFESEDLVHVRDTLERRGLIPSHVAVMGFSYGAATALMWAARDPHVMTVVAIAPFSSLYDVAPEYAKLLPRPLVHASVWWAGRLAGFDPSDNPLARAPKVKAATLIVHGDADVNIPVDEARAVAALLPNGSLRVMAGLTHQSMFDDDRVWNETVTWLRSHAAHPPDR